MKKIFMTLCAALTLVSCGMLNNSAASAPAATVTPAPVAATEPAVPATAVEAGKTAGASMLALYKQYQQDGNYNYTNLNNIVNTLTLIQSCQGLKENVKDANYRKQFSQGIMANATGLVTTDNVDKVTDNLTTLAGEYAEKAATATSSAAAKLETAAQTANSITSLLGLFAK